MSFEDREVNLTCGECNTRFPVKFGSLSPGMEIVCPNCKAKFVPILRTSDTEKRPEGSAS